MSNLSQYDREHLQFKFVSTGNPKDSYVWKLQALHDEYPELTAAVKQQEIAQRTVEAIIMRIAQEGPEDSDG